MIERCDTAKFWRVSEIQGLELLKATYYTQNFSRHMHDCYAFGVVEGGVQAFYYRHANHIATGGDIVTCVPGEVHTGHAPTDKGWTYRMFYPDVELLRFAASEVAGKQVDVPFIQDTIINDPPLAAMLLRLHKSLEDESTSLLERQSRLLMAFAQLVVRHGDDAQPLPEVGKEDDPIQEVRNYLDDHFRENISLEQLSSIANLSPFYLVRVFSKQVGLPPYAYLTQKRIMTARKLLRFGLSIADVALETGFTDQSHFHRHFKRVMGITPGMYQSPQ